MAFLEILITILLFLWDLFKSWLYIFISPFSKPEIFWIIIPIWVSWFFAEFFQEKRGTSFGNAISNGVIPLFVGVDWIRYLTNLVAENAIKLNYILYIKYSLCLLVILYGFSVIIFGIKARQFVHFYGRIREVTYVLIMFSPIIYGIIYLNWKFLLGIFLFFPIFYYFIELIDRFTPTPKIYEYDEGKTDQTSSTLTNIGSEWQSPESFNKIKNQGPRF